MRWSRVNSQAERSAICCRSFPHYCRSVTQHHHRYATQLRGNSLIFQASLSWHMVCSSIRASATLLRYWRYDMKGGTVEHVRKYQGAFGGVFRPGRLSTVRTSIYRPRQGPENLLEFSKTRENRRSRGKCEDQDPLTGIASTVRLSVLPRYIGKGAYNENEPIS